MADVAVLHAALKDLLPGGWTLYDGEVAIASPALPWIVWHATVPSAVHAAEGPGAYAGDVVLTTRVAASSASNANLILAQVVAAVGGAMPLATGWSIGALRENQPPRIDPMDLVISGASRHMWQGLASWKSTVSSLL